MERSKFGLVYQVSWQKRSVGESSPEADRLVGNRHIDSLNGNSLQCHINRASSSCMYARIWYGPQVFFSLGGDSAEADNP